MSECPTLKLGCQCSCDPRGMEGLFHLFTEWAVIRVLDFVEVVLVELPDETRKVGVLEHPRQNGFCKFVHILDDEAVAPRTP